MESLILYIILFITILIGSYLIFKINNIQKNIKNENNSEDINSLKEIGQKNPKYKDFINSQNVKMIKDLILKGLIKLSKTKRKTFLVEESTE